MTSYPILRFFRPEQPEPERLKEVSALFSLLAETMSEKLPRGAEVSAGLRKLLEAKDCAVRAVPTDPGDRRKDG